MKLEILNNLHIIIADKKQRDMRDDEFIVLYEELKNIGFISHNICDFDFNSVLKNIKQIGLDSKVDYKPMYPNFPEEVINKSEIDYRIEQFLSYVASFNYGVKLTSGETSYHTQEQTLNCPLKNVDFVTHDEFIAKLEMLLQSNSRLSNEVINIITYYIDDLDMSIDIPFKENKLIFATSIFNSTNIENSIKISNLKLLFEHSGEVIKFIVSLINNKKLTTSERKILVNLLDSFGEYDLSMNLSDLPKYLSKAAINGISYNKYSTQNFDSVDLFRNGKLQSFMSKLEIAISNSDFKTIKKLIQERPGLLLRYVTKISNNTNISEEQIMNELMLYGEKLKLDTLIGLYNSTLDKELIKKIVLKKIYSVNPKIQSIIQNKQIYLNDDMINLDESVYMPIKRENSNSGYLRDGLCLNLDFNKHNYIRAFVFWDDDFDYVDLDLHSSIYNNSEIIAKVGWNSNKSTHGVTTSGDLTWSNSAEYIDIDIDMAKSLGVSSINSYIHLYNGAKNFKNIDTAKFGIMVLDKNKNNIKIDKHFDFKNVLQIFNLDSQNKTSSNIVLDIQNNYIKFLPQEFIDEDFNFSFKELITSVINTNGGELITQKKSNNNDNNNIIEMNVLDIMNLITL